MAMSIAIPPKSDDIGYELKPAPPPSDSNQLSFLQSQPTSVDHRSATVRFHLSTEPQHCCVSAAHVVQQVKVLAEPISPPISMNRTRSFIVHQMGNAGNLAHHERDVHVDCRSN